MKRWKSIGLLILICLFLMGAAKQCGKEFKSDTGVTQAKADKVKKTKSGLSVEQRNVKMFYKVDNDPNAVKHAYCISPYSGKVILYSTLIGRITSSRKTLRPTRGYNSSGGPAFKYRIGNADIYSHTIMQDSGTFGSDDPPYIYWMDSKKKFHKQYAPLGCIFHVTTSPLDIKPAVINVEAYKSEG